MRIQDGNELRIDTTCCIVGGGPAGMMAGFLLARAGVDVVVLEKHADFLRDFRGDTVHPSTLELVHELGLLEDFLTRPHQKITRLGGVIGETRVDIADFGRLRVKCPFIAMMPQWDFLDFLASHSRQHPNFRLLMGAECTDLLWNEDRVIGARLDSRDGISEIHATLTIGADGRSSRVRDRADLAVEDLGAPIDVFWMRLSRKPDEQQAALGRVGAGYVFVMIDRGDYWQCAHVIPKGTAETVKARGLDAYRQTIAAAAPDLADRVDELRDWDQIKLLTVKVDRLTRWCKPGLLMIGDAAHAMSPIGGVGINLAVQDAVAAANLLAEPLFSNSVSLEDLQKVEKRRRFPTVITQALQVFLQSRVLDRVLKLSRQPEPPLLIRLVDRFPALQRIPARLVGIGVRPEHIRCPERAR